MMPYIELTLLYGMIFASKTDCKALSLFKGDERKGTKWNGAEGVTKTMP